MEIHEFPIEKYFHFSNENKYFRPDNTHTSCMQISENVENTMIFRFRLKKNMIFSTFSDIYVFCLVEKYLFS